MNQMKRISLGARQFLDLEARASDENSTDEEDEGDLQDPFIDTAADDDEDIFYQSLRDDNEAGADSTFFEDLLSRAYLNATGGSSSSDMDPRHGYTDQHLVFQPDADDFPLWRVSCRIGSEENVLSSLLLLARQQHQIRSAFTRGSIRGCIYLECNMNTRLVSLLEKVPGILRTHQGVLRSKIKPDDQMKLLRMESVNITVEAGKWVRVKKGLYKGDIGLVSATHHWGIELLLVPKLVYHPPTNKQKRKASAMEITARLFDPVDYGEALSVNIRRLQDGSYALGCLRFVNGLVVKTYDYHSISSPVQDIPWGHFTMFILSNHPDVNLMSMPRPSEWSFAEDDKVIIWSSRKTGILKSLGVDYAEVEIAEEGIYCFPWMDIRKEINVGDFVSAMDGDPRGNKGWVVELKDDIAVVCVNTKMDNDQTEGYAASLEDVNLLDFHVNCLRPTEKPFQFASQPTIVHKRLEKYVRHPWCGKTIIISKPGHPRKGETGEIIDVLLNQKTSTGMALVVQLTRFNPYAPFRKITIDCDYISEQSTGLGLDVSNQNRKRSTHYASEYINPPAVNFAGGATPIPTASSSTSPWFSQTPIPIPESDSIDTPPWMDDPPIPQFPAQAPTNKTLSHVLLNPSLANLEVNVIVNDNGRKYTNKELVASIRPMDGVRGSQGDMTMRYQKNGTFYFLEPEWVTPKFPSPTHDNGLLIFIRGEHCGKYARRVHHRHGASGTLMIVAIVKPVEGAADNLTGQQVSISPDHLCTVTETKEKKNLNKNLMQSLRETYRKNNPRY